MLEKEERVLGVLIATFTPPTQILMVLGAKLFGVAPSMDGSDWIVAFLVPFGSWYYLLFG